MKKYFAMFLCASLLLAGCQQHDKQDDKVVQDGEKKTTKQEKSIIPNDPLEKNEYKMILPYKTSAARGVIKDQMGNRLDIDEMETGLRRQSKKFYDPKKYYFQEGQYLDSDTVLDLIDDYNPDKDPKKGLSKKKKKQFYKDHPRYLSHILEQNYLTKNKDDKTKVQGLSIGLAIKSVYKYNVDDGPYSYRKISKKEMMKQGEKMAGKLLKKLRKNDKLKNVPIMFALYREEEKGSPVPGHFVAKTQAGKGDNSLGKWSSVNETHVLLPDKNASEKYNDDNKLVEDFGDKIQDFFPNYVGVVGDGFYVDGDLKKLTMEIPLDFYGKGEVIGFTQYVNGLVKDMFPDYYDIEIKVKSSNEVESVIYRKAGDKDPTVHVFD